MPQIVELTVEDSQDIPLELEGQEEYQLDSHEVVEVITTDYKKLNNKPTINMGYPAVGAVLEENYDEVDPTVPDWAKEEAPKEIDTTHIEFLWKSIFK